MPKSGPENAESLAVLPHHHHARLRTLVTWLTRTRSVGRQAKDPQWQKRVLWVNGLSVEVLTLKKNENLQEEFKELAIALGETLRKLRGKSLASVKVILGLDGDPGHLALRTLALGHHLKCWVLDLEGALGTGSLHDDEQVVIRDLRFT